MTDRFCVDCKHHVPPPRVRASEHRCRQAGEKTWTDPVTGRKDTIPLLLCATMRGAGAHGEGECGPSGRLWEPKPEPTLRLVNTGFPAVCSAEGC